MPTFISDPSPGLLLLGGSILVGSGLALAGAGALMLWLGPKEGWLRVASRAAIALGVLLVLLLLAWVVASAVLESPREESVRRVNDMAAALTAKDWPKFSENVSESFDAGGVKKADLKRYFDTAVASDARAVAWDFDFTDPPRVTDTEVVIQFEGKGEAKSGGMAMYHFEATFVKDPDGKFRMRGFTPFDYVQKNQKATIPGLPGR